MTVVGSLVGGLLPVCGRHISNKTRVCSRRRGVTMAITAVIDSITNGSVPQAMHERVFAKVAMRSQSAIHLDVGLPVPMNLHLGVLDSSPTRTRPTDKDDDFRPVAGVASVRGKRKTNEDRTVIRQLSDNLLLVGIFDGHGGSEAADFVAGSLPDLLECRLKQSGDHDLEGLLKRAFHDVNEGLTRALIRSELEKTFLHGRRPTLSCGTTATVCLLRGNSEIFVGHVGDSRATLCRDSVGLVLTKDHSLDDPVELDRILRCSGHVTRSNTRGPPRVNGVLEMTRSFGDVQLKQYGVSAEPEVTRIKVDTSRDEFLALTTDGVHNTLNAREIIEAASGCVAAAEAAVSLADEAIFYGSDDNCTALVLPLAAWKSDINSAQVVKFARAHDIFGGR